jgi:hypothetical protein
MTMNRALFSRAANSSQFLRHLHRFETSGSLSAFVGDLPAFVHYIEPIRPGSVSLLDFIIHIIYDSRKGKPQTAIASFSCCCALFHCLWLIYLDPRFYIGIDLPPIRRVSLADIDEKPFRFALILIIQPLQGLRLRPEGRSGIAAKDQHHRLFPSEI